MNRRLLRRISWFTLLICLTIAETFGQGEITDDAEIFYRYEKTFAGTLYSNGWGTEVSFTNRRDAFSSFTYSAGVGVINHPKEYKSQSPYTAGWGRSYVFGKTNEAMAIRIAAGYQKELFSKYDKGGIAIRYFYSGGLTLALLKPIYYQKIIRIDYETNDIIFDTSLFDPDYMQSVYDIYDRESFFVGLKETKLSPGAFIRTGLSFEYSSAERTITALECGVQLEGFLTKLPVMTGNINQQFFLSLFVSYRVGKVSDKLN